MSASKPAELIELESLIDAGGSALESRVVCEVTAGRHRFPVYAVSLGNPGSDVPAVGFFGGFHGLERIGSEVVLAFLRSLVIRLRWDALLRDSLEHIRLLFMPVVNPGGIWKGTRANPSGVDLMRNAPLDSKEGVPFLVGGQRISANLPWYRGATGAAMEPESQAVCRVVEEELLSREFSLVLDCHSGFGISDRIWFPYAHTALPIAHLAEMHALVDVFESTYAHHPYLFEPQSRQYRAHGDIWDYLYQRAVAEEGKMFLPMTLEMGSWLWVKKNPRQLFSKHGIFNPLIEHRQQRVMRRHMSLLDFLIRATMGHRHWLPADEQRTRHRELALARWYAGSRP